MSFHCSMNVKIPSRVLSESFLIGVLYLVRTLSLYEEIFRPGRPYVYSTILMVQLFIIKSWMRIPSNNTLHYFLSIKCNNDKLFKVCRLTQIPDRRTIDRRFQNLPIGDIIGTMGNLFVSEGMVDDTSASVGSSMLKANGPVWHKSDMKNNRLPISGIDTDARWGFSKSKGRIFGYKLHMSCSTGKLIVPLSAGFSTANIHDGKMFDALIKSLSGIIQNILADPAYDDSKLHDSCGKKHLRWVTPIRQYPRTPRKGSSLWNFIILRLVRSCMRIEKPQLNRSLRYSKTRLASEQFP